jgi:alkyldihydroxyacetonephosphate synthase
VGERRRKFWGWGYEDGGPTPEQEAGIVRTLAHRLGAALTLAPVPRVAEIELPPPRVAPPERLRPICSHDPYERLSHSLGKGYRDVVRALRRRFDHPPDLVAFPADEADVVAILEWASAAGVAVVPYGGGSSVVGGVEPDVGDTFAGTLSLDLRQLDRVLEIDRTSRAARIQAGVLGPALEDQLRPHGLTLRHYPQSFEFSSLGGWIATRSGGHFATLYTHIDEFVESLHVVTPSGVVETRRLPGSGAGPAPDRLFLGSEGALGVITEAWMRLQDRPRFRASAAVRFPGDAGFARGAEAVRALSQSGLNPANCRLLDAPEAATAAAGAGDAAVLLVAFESADHALDAWITRAVELVRDAGGELPEGEPRVSAGGAEGARAGAAGAWRSAFLNAPYLRDVLARAAVVSETFETAVTWDRFPAFHDGVVGAVRDALAEACGGGTVSCRFTHVYPDGPAPYYTVLAPGRRGSELEQWDAIKTAASDAILRLGGTITHHHAVGRDHRPWYARELPDGFTGALAAAKRALDPAGVLNPGVLLPAP